jgi:glutaconate CoA-transferase subunit A
MSALQAGVMNVPFVPVRGLLGTDYMKVRPDFRAIVNPYDPREEIAIVPAIAPDVAVFHGFRGDRHGNVVTTRTTDARLIAQASRMVIATVEELADGNLAETPSTGVLVPGIHVSAVVLAPRGAHPTSCRGHYEDDVDHIRDYLKSARDDQAFQAYLERYVLGVADHAEYLERAGMGSAAAAGSIPGIAER